MVETVSAMIFTIPVQSLFSLTVVMYSSVYIVQNLKISSSVLCLQADLPPSRFTI